MAGFSKFDPEKFPRTLNWHIARDLDNGVDFRWDFSQGSHGWRENSLTGDGGGAIWHDPNEGVLAIRGSKHNGWAWPGEGQVLIITQTGWAYEMRAHIYATSTSASLGFDHFQHRLVAESHINIANKWHTASVEKIYRDAFDGAGNHGNIYPVVRGLAIGIEIKIKWVELWYRAI